MTCDLTELSLEVGEVDDTLGRVERPWHKRATALIMASQNGHGEVVGKLLQKGASVDVPSRDGRVRTMTHSPRTISSRTMAGRPSC